MDELDKETGQTQDAVKRGHLHNDEAEFVDAVIYSEASLCIYFGVYCESTESDFHPMIAPGTFASLHLKALISKSRYNPFNASKIKLREKLY